MYDVCTDIELKVHFMGFLLSALHALEITDSTLNRLHPIF